MWNQGGCNTTLIKRFALLGPLNGLPFNFCVLSGPINADSTMSQADESNGRWTFIRLSRLL